MAFRLLSLLEFFFVWVCMVGLNGVGSPDISSAQDRKSFLLFVWFEPAGCFYSLPLLIIGIAFELLIGLGFGIGIQMAPNATSSIQ